MESIESLQRRHRNEHAQGRPPLRRHGFIKFTPLEGLVASPQLWWCLVGDLCFLFGFWLVTHQSDTSYLRFRGVTKCSTQACTNLEVVDHLWLSLTLYWTWMMFFSTFQWCPWAYKRFLTLYHLAPRSDQWFQLTFQIWSILWSPRSQLRIHIHCIVFVNQLLMLGVDVGAIQWGFRA